MEKQTLYIKNSKSNGKGIFTSKEIKKGSKIFLFSDKIIKIKHERGCDCSICCRCIQIGEFDWLYPGKESYGWYINHNCEPNSGINGKEIVSMKDISADEEITIDYSTTNADKDWTMKCSCKSKNCRKLIRSVQYLSLELYEKYKEFMPDYISKIYESK